MVSKLIWQSGIVALITTILILGGGELTGTVDIGKEKLYGCEAREIVMPCDSLSKYYSLSNGKCRNAELGNKLCRSGWTQDFQVIDEVKEPVITTCEPEIITNTVMASCPDVRVIKYDYINGEQVKYVCDGVGEYASCQEFSTLMG